ncbi:hypothetical protein OTU49_004089 [Cherax quadricarinatus]|uniref:small monomeric GTPase n=1 Tax=Cherax quadricarinatus TaxID=27406 RepID=A0AAW0X4Z8_CHEQU
MLLTPPPPVVQPLLQPLPPAAAPHTSLLGQDPLPSHLHLAIRRTPLTPDSLYLELQQLVNLEEGEISEAHARWGDGFLLAFSLIDRRSFSAISTIHAAVAAARHTPNFSCVIVANKTDLGHLAEVSEDEATELAGELGASLFMTSACDGGPSIQAAFFELHRDVVRRRWSRRRRSSAKTVIEGFYKMFSR